MFKGKLKLSVRLKIIFLSCFLITFIVASLSFFFIRREVKFIKTHEQEENITRAYILAFDCRDALLAHDTYRLHQLITSVCKLKQVMYTIILDDDGKVVMHNNLKAIGKTHTDSLGTRAAKTEEDLVQHYHSPEGLHLMDVAVPIKTGDLRVGVVRIGVSMEALNDEISELEKTVLGFSIIFILAGAFMSILLSNRITRPITELIHATQKVGRREFGTKISISSGDEIAVLADSFNKMSENLQETTVSLDYVDKIMKSMIDTLIVIDPEAKIKRVNSATCKALGYKEDELIGKQAAAVLEEDLFKSPKFEELIKKGFVSNVKITYLSKDGRRIPMLFSGSVMRDAGGNIEGVVCVAQDITDHVRAEEEKKKLEARLQQAQKMEAIGTLAGGIAHDFNNLLMGIQGHTSLMLITVDPSHPHYDRLQNIEKQVQSGAKLTSHLLGYARKGRYAVKPLDLNQLVKETSEAFGRTKKEITIHSKLADDLFTVEADAAQIEQVLFNLLINAADAMPNGGNIVLRTLNITHKDMKDEMYDPRPGNYVRLTVTDTGTGMDEDTLERIFDPFFTTKEMGRGTGLGLASAYGIIKSHRGYIDVESEKGEGTTFSVYLPASEKKIKEPVKTSEQVVQGTGTVLLVDDEEIVLEVGRDLLEAIGYRVLTARDGKEAVEVYRKNRDGIDIVLLDMVMPNIGGGEAYDRMKEINPDIKVLLSSGYSIDGQANEILKRGCNGFIQKPFDINQLSGKIKEILEKE